MDIFTVPITNKKMAYCIQDIQEEADSQYKLKGRK